MNTSLNSNSIAFIGLCNEFCIAVENARESQRDEFLDTMLHLLPRIYIAATDLRTVSLSFDDTYIGRVLEEDYYESVRRSMEGLFGEYDVYLEVFEEDMKYSDTPVAASISEGLADIFQVVFNFLHTVGEATDETIALAVSAISDDFRSFWSGTLCNVLRALNHLRYSQPEEEI